MVLLLDSEAKGKEKFGSILALGMTIIFVLFGAFGGTAFLWMRWLTVLVVSLAALTVPSFADFVSLVGSGVCIALSFVFPTLFHCLVFKEELGWSCIASDGAIMVFGLMVTVTGTLALLMEILSPEART
ncbi:hypothetical protein K1719_019247 [Acacia pycnantha]|nr:hypothetical protein K1719_019247 [Acacia pycnantha]